MVYTALISLTAFMFCLSLFLMHKASVLENDFRKLHGDIILQLNQPRSEGVNGRMAKTREDIKPRVFQKVQGSVKLSSKKVKREQSISRAPTSFLQFKANTNKQPDIRGNITVIPWTVSAQQGNTISQKENRIVVQEDGYYLVFGQVLCHSNLSITKLILRVTCSNFSANALLKSQVLFESPSTVMGHIIQSWGSAGRRATRLLRCLQEMPDKTPANTCYTAGTVQLFQDDELELVILDRPNSLISMDEDSTFFGVIQLN
ncbi:tumor necrosis factor ligand superfamily member 13B-like isoform X1 [Mugil cephalus]|uniref:tumor necrosis factor ligand superfamily member 13B-like isoform X1 n=1 Tax=Mugil cephalus TaxID=48193 RepID=UPI001FB73A0F|nr:tumor necrosis factor ligand superfamily member 13B-like isoform X1 [Mugil cephalus]